MPSVPEKEHCELEAILRDARASLGATQDEVTEGCALTYAVIVAR